MIIPRFSFRPVLGIASVGCLALLAGCATPEEKAAQADPVVESATPSWTRDAPPATTRQAKPRKPAKPKPPGFTKLDPDSETEAGERHRQALLSKDGGVLSSEEVGYYMDTHEARLIQLLRDSRISIDRENNDISLLIAGGNIFNSNSARLTDEASAMLEPVASVLEEYSDTRITIYGHTDDQGEADYNQQLSERRARSIARKLAQAGVARERIAIVGYGESQPVAANDTEEGRDLNRRIVLLIEPLALQE